MSGFCDSIQSFRSDASLISIARTGRPGKRLTVWASPADIIGALSVIAIIILSSIISAVYVDVGLIKGACLHKYRLRDALFPELKDSPRPYSDFQVPSHIYKCCKAHHSIDLNPSQWDNI